MTNKPEPTDTNIDERIEAALKSTHRVGSHSGDYGGTSDFPCYCTAKAQIKQLIADEVAVEKAWQNALKIQIAELESELEPYRAFKAALQGDEK